MNQKELDIEKAQLVMGDFHHMKEAFEKLPNDLSAKKFMGLNNYSLYLSCIDPRTRRTRAISDKEAVELHNFGFKKLTNKGYLEFFEMIKPERLVILSEEKIDSEGKGTKSIKRSIDKSINFLKQTCDFMQADTFKGDKSSKILAPIYGGDFMELRKHNLKELRSQLHKLSGFVIYNLFREETYGFRKQFYCLLNAYMSNHNISEYEVVLSCTGNPLQIIEGVINGVDLFETQYPFILAQEGLA